MYLRLNNAKKTLLDDEELDDYLCALDAYCLPDGQPAGLVDIGRQSANNRMSRKVARMSGGGHDSSTKEPLLSGGVPMSNSQTSRPLSSQVAEMEVLPVPKEEATPWYKNKMYIIIGVFILLLLVGGIIGLIVALGSSSSGPPCVKSGPNLCKCSDGVEYPVIIDTSIVFHNKTFLGAEVDRIKTVNCNNTVSTYSIFKEIDEATLQCQTTMGTIDF